jgi:dihydroneopterin aldolase
MSISMLHSNLVLPGVRCRAHIGVSDAERAHAQWVVVDVALGFSSPPHAMISDQLEHTVDYAALTAAIVRCCSARHYALLERLSCRLYEELRALVRAEVGLWLEVAKLRPPLPELEHGARFGVGDWQAGAAVTSARRGAARAPQAGSNQLVLLRAARPSDRPALDRLVELSVRGLASEVYSPLQIEAALGSALGVDSALIEDGTYFVLEHAQQLIAAGGWSRFDKRFGADTWSTEAPRRLDPSSEAARIRAFFVHPAWARRGLARALLECCEGAASAQGFRSAELTATLSGEPFYRAQGYEALAPLDYALNPSTAIRFVPMRKVLVAP